MTRSLVRLGLSISLSAFFVLGCAGYGAEAGDDYGGAGGESGGGGGTETALGGGAGFVPTDGRRSGGFGVQLAGDAAKADASSPYSDLPACKNDVASVPFYMSADDSNSMASPAIAREHLTAGLAPNPAQIRTYEFLNYYNALYDIPAMGDGKLGVHIDLQDIGVSPTDKVRRYRLQVGVQAFAVDRVPLVLTYVVDTSGSIVGTGLDREREALLAIGTHLREGDIVNVVTWSSKDSVLLEGYVAKGTPDDQAVLAQVIAGLLPGGGSDLHAGLKKGYDLAQAHFDVEKLNRVVLLSDGGANLGVLDRDVIAEAAEQAQEEGIYLVGVGVGPAEGYTDALMDLVTDAGRGAYVYLDSTAEAQSLFNDRFDEVMNVAARDVRVEIALPPYFDIESFYGEEYSQVESDIEPQNLAPGDAMIFNETLLVTNTAGMCGDDLIGVKVRWQTPLAHEDRLEEPDPVSLTSLLGQPISPQMRKANAVIAYAEALKDPDHPMKLTSALATVNQAIELAPEPDDDLDAIAALIALHPQLGQK